MTDKAIRIMGVQSRSLPYPNEMWVYSQSEAKVDWSNLIPKAGHQIAHALLWRDRL